MEYHVKHYPEKNRFETVQDGFTAYVEYWLNGNNMDIYRTYVPPQIEGRGIAAALVDKAYEYADKNDLKIIPTCSYVKVWLKRKQGS